MLFRIGQKEFQRNRLIDSLIILLLVSIFSILILVTNSLIDSTRKYRMVIKLLADDGCFYGVESIVNLENREFIRDNDSLETILGENIIVAGQYILPSATINNEESNIWSYDWSIVQNYKPDIVDGRWFNKADLSNDKEIYGVLLARGEIAVGDKVTIRNWNGECPVEVTIIGLLEDGASVFDFDFYSSKAGDYTDCFYSYLMEYEQLPLLLLLNDQLGLFNYFNPDVEGLQGEGIARQQEGALFVSWTEEVLNEQLDYIEHFFRQEPNNILYSIPTQDMINRSKNTVWSLLDNVLPVFICTLILVTIATITVSMISVKKQFHNYAIYYICGLDWNRCLMISVIHSWICSFWALFITVIGTKLISMLNMFENINVEFSLIGWIACILLQLIFVGISILFPYIILQNNSAKSILNKPEMVK